MEHSRPTSNKPSSSELKSLYGAGIEYEKVQKRRDADAKCRANIAECFSQLKIHIHNDAKLSKTCVLQESLHKIHYLEAIVSLQLMNVKGGWSSPAWKQITVQSMHQEFIKSYKKGLEIKKRPEKIKKVHPSSNSKKASKNKTGSSSKGKASMNADQVVPCSPAVDYQHHLCKSTMQVETKHSTSVSSSNVRKVGGCRNACLTPDLTCNENINEDQENSMMFCTPRQYRLILPNNAPRKSKHQLDGMRKQHRKKRKLDFGQTEDHVAALFRNKKKKTDKKRLKKQSSSARTRPWDWIWCYYDNQRKYQETPHDPHFQLGSYFKKKLETERSHGLRGLRRLAVVPNMDNRKVLNSYDFSDDICEEVDVIGDYKSDIDVRILYQNESAVGESGGSYLQERSNIASTQDDDGILRMILEMENEFSGSNQGCIDAFMGNKEYSDDCSDNYGIATSSLASPTNETSSLPSPVGFTDVAMDSDFFDAIRSSSFRMDMLQKSDPEVVHFAPSPSENSIFCFENDEDLSGSDLTCYEDDLPKSSFSLYSPQKRSVGDMPSFEISDKCNISANEMTDTKESILRWRTSIDSVNHVYQKERKVNISSVDDSTSASSVLQYQVVPQLMDDDLKELPYMVDDDQTGSSANPPPPSPSPPHKMKWFLQDPKCLTCYEGIEDM